MYKGLTQKEINRTRYTKSVGLVPKLVELENRSYGRVYPGTGADPGFCRFNTASSSSMELECLPSLGSLRTGYHILTYILEMMEATPAHRPHKNDREGFDSIFL